MRAILTFENDKKTVIEILKLPDKPVSAKQIEQDIMNKMNEKLTNHKIVKVHLLRN